MKLTITAAGTRGDVQPYVALGTGLAAAGFDVQMLTSDDFESLVTHAGLGFRSIGGSIEQTLQSDEWRQTVEGGNFLKIMRKMNEEMTRRAHELAAKVPSLLADSDLIVAGTGGVPGTVAVAEKSGKPLVLAFVFPITPTRDYASPLMPFDSLGGALNRASFYLMQAALWQTGRVGDLTVRRELGIAPPPRLRGAVPRMIQHGTPLLYGFSRHVLPPSVEWSANIHTTGYWFLDQTWTPPDDLIAFLERGASPVYIGFGSMSARNPEESAKIALDALALSGQRGVIASGWGGLHAEDLPDNVYMLRSAPHGWLFPRMSAVVHHGGAGTTAAGLRAGVPTVIIPFMGDQAFWGRRTAHLGVGTAPIPRKRLTAQSLAAAITRTVTDQAMRQRAAELGEKIRAEDGISNAVQVIQRYATEINLVRYSTPNQLSAADGRKPAQ